jgi:ADP-ribose pyrophosphatase
VQPDESRTVYDGKLIDVVVERWGENEREIVEHPGAVAIVAVDGEDRVAFVRQLREPARARLLEIPAGTLDPGESPEECARRELREETGLHGGSWSPLARFWTTPGFCRELMHVYVAEGVEAGEAAPAQDEELELVHVDLAELDGRLDELQDAKTLTGVLLYLRRRGHR